MTSTRATGWALLFLGVVSHACSGDDDSGGGTSGGATGKGGGANTGGTGTSGSGGSGGSNAGGPASGGALNFGGKSGLGGAGSANGGSTNAGAGGTDAPGGAGAGGDAGNTGSGGSGASGGAGASGGSGGTPPGGAGSGGEAGGSSGLTVTSLASGNRYSCSIVASGSAWCWGSNGLAKLGDGNVGGSSNLPVRVADLEDVTQIAPGTGHTCAIASGGRALCWGGNSVGQLGSGDKVDAVVPTQVVGLVSGTRSIAAGNNHSCAVTGAGAAVCWGDNTSGQLGDGSGKSSTQPVIASGLDSGVASVVAGYRYSCALKTTGAVLCWGQNGTGQLGSIVAVGSLTPVPVTNLDSGVSAITAGLTHACALTEDGAALCWGSNVAGELGTEKSGTAWYGPVPVAGLDSGVIAISAGDTFTCAVMASGTVHCWGTNGAGQLGAPFPTVSSAPTPVAVSPFADAESVAVGDAHACALRRDGSAWCWGAGSYGQLGNGTSPTTRTTTPVRVSGIIQ